MKPANLFIRSIAFILDSMIIGVISKLVMLLFGISSDFLVTEDEMIMLIEQDNLSLSEIVDIEMFSLYLTFSNVFFVLYFSVFEATSWQATPMKKIFKLKIKDQYGNRPSFIRIIIRNISKLLSGYIFLIGYIIALFSKKRKALHDIIAGCIVVDTDS